MGHTPAWQIAGYVVLALIVVANYVREERAKRRHAAAVEAVAVDERAAA